MPSTSLARLVPFVPALSLAAYDVADQVGAVNNLGLALDINNDSASLLSIVVVDASMQKADLDILLFNEAPTVASVDNAPLSITAAEMAAKFLGKISISGADYSDLATCSVATVTGIGLLLEGITEAKTLHAVVQCQSTPTFVSATDLTIKLGLLQD